MPELTREEKALAVSLKLKALKAELCVLVTKLPNDDEDGMFKTLEILPEISKLGIEIKHWSTFQLLEDCYSKHICPISLLRESGVSAREAIFTKKYVSRKLLEDKITQKE